MTHELEGMLNDGRKDIISIDKESANEQRAKTIGVNYQPYWIEQ